LEELGDKTPLQYADTSNMDRLSKDGRLGLVKTIPDGYAPGSDVAALSILGYDPAKYYTGRSPLEAANMGVKLEDNDLSFRCNLVSLDEIGGKIYMADFSAGHISTEEAREIITYLDQELSDDGVRFYPGVSYRHLMVWSGGDERVKTTPPHDISGMDIVDYLPQGKGADKLISVMTYSQMLLKDHPVNIKRVEEGKKPANSIWLWGEGKRPTMPTLKERFGLNGSIISAVDLMNGLGIYAGLEVVKVPGATGYIDTNFKGKAEYAIRELNDKDIVCVHVEAPDEAGHNGNVLDKVQAIESFDHEVVGRIADAFKGSDKHKLLVLCDHATPIATRTHTSDPVPFIIYPDDCNEEVGGYNEASAKKTGIFIEKGHNLLEILMGRITLANGVS